MADTSTSGWFNLLDLDEDKSIVAPTTVQGSRYSTNSQGIMSSDVRKMQATKADSAPTDVLTTIVNNIVNGFSGDTEDLTDRPVAGRDVANDVYKEYDKLVGVGQLFMDATDPPAPAPASEDPDRKFYQSGVPIEDRVLEATDEPDLSDLQITDSKGIKDMPPLPKAATEEGGLMVRPKARPESLSDDDMGLTKEVSEAALFSKIVGGESDDYNTVYLGSKVNPIKPITEMTVKEVREWQDTSVKAGSKSSAAGRFQIIRSTMDTLLSKGAIAETDIFDEETQLKAYTALLKKRKYPQLKASIQNSTDPDEKRKYAERLQINLSMEFASIPVPKSIKKDYFGEGLPIVDLKKGQSFYYNPKKPNLNKAQHKSDDFMTILMAL